MMGLQQIDIFNKTMEAVAAVAGRPLLYGPNNKPLLPSADYAFRRDAAKRTGSFKNWVPQRLFGKQSEATDREAVVKRSIDLSNNDPHAAGVIDTYAATEIGAGLTPHVAIDTDVFGIEKEEARRIQIQQRSYWQSWAPFADAGGRMNFGQVQYLTKVCMMRYGEFFVVLPMLKDTTRPGSLACQVIHPLRVKTPVDKISDQKIRDGIELGEYGQAVAVWVKKSGPYPTADTSANFLRIPVKKGHRFNILHGFICKEPEQVRGWPFFAPVMKFFRDLNDLLNAELVSNVVTAALSYFIEVSSGTDPYDLANNLKTLTDTRTDSDGSTRNIRYEETYPGRIMYGNTGEKPHLLAANRPGTTFDPFVKTIKKSMAMGLNMPYPVLFKDVDGVSFAGFRSAMLDAWRVFMMEREWHGGMMCQPIYSMVQEEGWLRNKVDYGAISFYDNIHALTQAQWRGAPKGDIEPIKAVKADLLAIEGNLKTHEQAIIERGEDPRAVFDKLEEEKEDLENRGLLTEPDPAAQAQQNEAIAEGEEAIIAQNEDDD